MLRIVGFCVVPVCVLGLLLPALSCQSKTRGLSTAEPNAKASPSVGAVNAVASAAADVASLPALPQEPRKLAEHELNPDGAAYYTGPVGAIAGVVTLKGDAPPADERLARVPVGECFAAHKQLKAAFNVSRKGELADVLVAATGYPGRLKIPTEPRMLVSKDCAFAQRTVALMYGQELLVNNLGPDAVSPELLGAPRTVLRFAVPGGHPVPLFPSKLGRFVLINRTHDFATADVFALAYPTTAVTDEAGKFSISGIPVGEVSVNAYLPATGQTVQKKVTVVAGQTVQLDFELEFKLAVYQDRVKQGVKAVEARRSELLQTPAVSQASPAAVPSLK